VLPVRGESEKFILLETDGKVGNKFKAVYDLHMPTEALSTALTYSNMHNVFQIIPTETIEQLTQKLQDLFACQAELCKAADDLSDDPGDKALITLNEAATFDLATSTSELEAINIMTIDLLTSFKAVDTMTILLPNRYHAQYGADYTVENLTWSAENILATCEEFLRNKIRKQLIGVSPLEQGRPLVLKLMLDFFMDIEDRALRLLVQSVQVLRVKDVPG